MENPDYSEGYIVKTSSTEESSFVVRYLKGLPPDTPDFGNKFKYVIYSPLAPNNNLFDYLSSDVSHYPILTFEEFKEKILNIKTMEKRKIIGRKVPTDIKWWGLKKDQIILLKYLGEYANSYICKGINIPIEIFNTWESVYEVEEKIFKMGLSLKSETFVLKVKEGKCFYGKKFEKDVTFYVQGLISRHHQNNLDIEGEKCTVDEITFSETLEPILTTYDQWEEVFNYMMKQRQES